MLNQQSPSQKTQQWNDETNLSEAQKLKQLGNIHFTKKQYKEALRKYHRAILHLAGIIDKDSSVAIYAKTASKQISNSANTLKFNIWLNMSQIYINEKKYEKGLEIIKKAEQLMEKKLSEEIKKKYLSKLYYRKGICFLKQNYFVEARQQFSKLNQIDSSFLKQTEELEKQIQDRQRKAEEKSKKLYQGFFK